MTVFHPNTHTFQIQSYFLIINTILISYLLNVLSEQYADKPVIVQQTLIQITGICFNVHANKYILIWLPTLPFSTFLTVINRIVPHNHHVNISIFLHRVANKYTVFRLTIRLFQLSFIDFTTFHPFFNSPNNYSSYFVPIEV